jgi:hypothetical protein
MSIDKDATLTNDREHCGPTRHDTAQRTESHFLIPLVYPA